MQENAENGDAENGDAFILANCPEDSRQRRREKMGTHLFWQIARKTAGNAENKCVPISLHIPENKCVPIFYP
jgi:hypothetical protein